MTKQINVIKLFKRSEKFSILKRIGYNINIAIFIHRKAQDFNMRKVNWIWIPITFGSTLLILIRFGWEWFPENSTLDLQTLLAAVGILGGFKKDNDDIFETDSVHLLLIYTDLHKSIYSTMIIISINKKKTISYTCYPNGTSQFESMMKKLTGD